MKDLTLILTGFSVVMAVLAFLWTVCGIVGWLHKPREHKKKQPNPAPSSDILTEPPAAHLAVICAAVAAVTNGPYRIVKVNAPAHTTLGWIQTGRRVTDSSLGRRAWSSSRTLSTTESLSHTQMGNKV